MLGRLLRPSRGPWTARTSLRSLHSNTSPSASVIRLQALKPIDDADALQVTWTDGFTAKFHRAWLRDNCSCPACKHPTTLQRQVLTAAIPVHPTGPAQLHDDNQSMSVQWDAPVEGTDCVHSIYSAAWLRDHAYSDPSVHGSYNKHYRQQHLPALSLWGKELDFPTTTFASVMDEQGSGFRDAMHQLKQFGVLLIRGTPSSMDETERFARRIGFVLETIYGGMWTTRPTNPDQSYNDTASTNLALGPHTDCTYLYEPPGLQIFNCVLQANTDGEGSSRFVDGFHVVEWLRAHAPETYLFFVETPLHQYCIDDDVSLHTMKPLIQLDARGNVEAVRFNDYDRAPLTHLSFDQVGAFYKHHKVLWQAIHEGEVVYKMSVGDMIVVDNQRVFHGRHAFQGERALIGCYIGRSEYDSRLRMLDLL
ncbi:Aste57867_24538 [Aphanomyces stellatus]|uniref:trimethyllysine dioxygenase n=1 Tax=Aphanomyces stellatus TaxID=120398 RepID=A0A485LQL9_9STRA|nr:hypothetical protein As57867_024461 [Aphanomyces stellatus]VFU01177.1 Aste57867_24538 [Aphanomyces stellatus]